MTMPCPFRDVHMRCRQPDLMVYCGPVGRVTAATWHSAVDGLVRGMRNHLIAAHNMPDPSALQSALAAPVTHSTARGSRSRSPRPVAGGSDEDATVLAVTVAESSSPGRQPDDDEAIAVTGGSGAASSRGHRGPPQRPVPPRPETTVLRPIAAKNKPR
jgi:hypothetical protein